MQKCLTIFLYKHLLLKSNENYEPFIEINKEAQQSLAVVIHRMFKLDSK